ncbi:uroporphyrinogen-III synthase [Salisediminibacterium halotolerans]|nr:uroporphyrinogen-III synthase [Salisediminibacterium haloalkalitolerans]
MNDLSGWKLMNTRAAHQAAPLSEAVRTRGGQVKEIPLIRIAPEERREVKARAFQAFLNADWAVFTSANSIDVTVDLLREYSDKSLKELFAGKKTAAVGEKTKKKLEGFGLVADLLPDTFDAEHLASLLVNDMSSGQTVFYPKSKQARTVLQDRLTKAQVKVLAAELYDTVPEQRSENALERSLLHREIDAVMFASPSAVHSFYRLSSVKARARFEERGCYAVIGPVTLEALRTYGATAIAVPDKYTIEGMLDSISQYKPDSDTEMGAEK